MRTSNHIHKCILIITIAIIAVTACNQPYSQSPSATFTPASQNIFSSPGPTDAMQPVEAFATGTAIAQLTISPSIPVDNTPATQPVITPLIETATPLVGEVTQMSDQGMIDTATAFVVNNIIADELKIVDDNLSQSMKASIAYNTPESMNLFETVTIVLYINPSQTPEQLAAELSTDQLLPTTGQAPVVTSTIEITNRMKAELITDDKEAFTAQSIPSNPEQLMSNIDSTRWAWLLTAQKPGDQKLTLIVSRLVKYAGLEYWRPIETYKAGITVKVTLGQQIASFDWKWLIGIVIPLIGIPSLWSYLSNRKKKTNLVE